MEILRVFIVVSQKVFKGTNSLLFYCVDEIFL